MLRATKGWPSLAVRANHGKAEFEECFADHRSSFVTNAQAPKLVKRGDAALDDLARLAEVL
jgi:hypothetical protein